MLCFIIKFKFCVRLSQVECYLKFLLFIGKPLFSIDIHPDGTRFATGGQGKYEHFRIKAVLI